MCKLSLRECSLQGKLKCSCSKKAGSWIYNNSAVLRATLLGHIDAVRGVIAPSYRTEVDEGSGIVMPFVQI